jgi:nitroimidazol reductase NimA-like FMN-containing flavoprotein (pyridoxamine 5'-phosphate oxidase superfamily)
MSATQPTSERTAVRRHAERGRYDSETVHAILDEGLVGHLAFVADGQPFAIPMLYARSGEQIYLHGSPRSRVLGVAAEGVPVCLTVTLIDGLVLARSAFHHSMNYRSVVLLGRARSVEDRDEKLEAMRLLVEQIVPGRTADARGPSAGELKTTEMLAMSIDEASAKVRTGPPIDSKRDLKLPVWAGVVPLTLVPQAPLPDDECAAAAPSYVTSYRRPGTDGPAAA